jgi:hypothetical protein
MLSDSRVLATAQLVNGLISLLNDGVTAQLRVTRKCISLEDTMVSKETCLIFSNSYNETNSNNVSFLG